MADCRSLRTLFSNGMQQSSVVSDIHSKFGLVYVKTVKWQEGTPQQLICKKKNWRREEKIVFCRWNIIIIKTSNQWIVFPPGVYLDLNKNDGA